MFFVVAFGRGAAVAGGRGSIATRPIAIRLLIVKFIIIVQVEVK